jgi:hypothetical protein
MGVMLPFPNIWANVISGVVINQCPLNTVCTTLTNALNNLTEDALVRMRRILLLLTANDFIPGGSVLQCKTGQYNTVQYNTIKYNTTHHTKYYTTLKANT